MLFGSSTKPSEREPAQLRISVSAVDMVAANMPASTSPITAGCRTSMAIVGGANSGTKPAVSGRNHSALQGVGKHHAVLLPTFLLRP